MANFPEPDTDRLEYWRAPPLYGLWIAISPPLPATAELLITLIGVIHRNYAAQPAGRRRPRAPPPPTADTDLYAPRCRRFFPDRGLFFAKVSFVFFARS